MLAPATVSRNACPASRRPSHVSHTIRILNDDAASGRHTCKCRCRGPAHTDAESENGCGLCGLPKGSRCRRSCDEDHQGSDEPLSAFWCLHGETWLSPAHLLQQKTLTPLANGLQLHSALKPAEGADLDRPLREDDGSADRVARFSAGTHNGA